MVYFKENYFFLRSRGGSARSRVFGVQMLISIETYRICDFPGGSGPLIPPLDLRMRIIDPLAISKIFKYSV